MLKSLQKMPILCFLLLTHFIVAQKTESYSFSSLNTVDGLSQGRITKIIQDQSNFIWFGTADGLNRYDGYSFLVFRHKKDNPSSISNNIINDIKETHDGKLLIATNDGFNLFDPVTNSFTHLPIYNVNSPDMGFRSITSILVPRNEKDFFYYGTKAGLIKYQYSTKSNKLLFALTADLAVNERSIRTLFESEKGDIWIGTGGEGLFVYNPAKDKIKKILVSPNKDVSKKNLPVTSIADDGDGHIFVTDFLDIYAFDENGVKLRDVNKLDKPTVPTTIIKASKGEIYIAYLGKGLVRYSFNDDKYTFIKDISATDSLEQKFDFLSLYIDRSNTLWCGSNGWGIRSISPHNNLFKRFSNFSPSLKSIRSVIQLKDASVIVSGYRGLTRLYPDFSMEDLNSGIYEEASGLSLSVFSLIEDIREPNKVLWVGSEGGGLYKFTIDSRNIEMIKGDYTKGDFFRGEFVSSLFWGSDSMLYIGTERGLHILDTRTNYLKFYPPTIGGEALVSFGLIYDMDEYKDLIYLSTERNGIVMFNPGTGDFSSFLSTGMSSSALPTNDIRALYFKNDDTCYIASNSGFCVFDRTKKTLKTYTMQDGLPNDLIYSILEDDSGKLWLSTNVGVSCFNPHTGKFLNYNKSEGLPGNEFNSKSYLKLKNGDMIFGGVEGFCIFNPAAIISDNLNPNPTITNFSLFSKEVPVGKFGDKIILDSAIHLKKIVNLDYDENNIGLEFTTLNYNVNSGTKYSYILEGFEEEWSIPSATRKAVYTNLDHGEYKFRVATITRDGSKSENMAELYIIVAPPFWRTTWFRILALILVIGIIYSGYKYKTTSIRKRNEELEKLVDNRTRQLETKKTELELRNHELIEANASKNRFFSMFSHDLRSPFSAILGYLQILNEDFDELTESERTYYFQSLYTVSRNLFTTIENVFNWFRIETGRINDEPKLLLLEQSVKEAVDILVANITLKKIEIIVEVEPGTRVWADPVMLKTILQNLISNAIKFSDEEGIISISSNSKDGMVAVSVSDSGRGMTEEELGKLFDKKIIFTKEGTQQEKGSGLGLLICKEFVEKCGGTITVTSSRDDGTSFTFTLPDAPRTN